MSSFSMTAMLKLKSNVNAADKFIENLVENQKRTESATIYDYISKVMSTNYTKGTIAPRTGWRI